ncbi:hypothetical protein M0R45_015601 [Rubus argutus]|uniref:Uncharacterized protein n=1 Tax=Rubus argutus TaxID=59490 RepID=A0AAW1XQN4_RUBAR
MLGFSTAFIKVLGNEMASKEVFNISGEKYVTFDGLTKACTKAAGFPEPEIVHYNPKEFDFGKKKAFPFRMWTEFRFSRIIDIIGFVHFSLQ